MKNDAILDAIVCFLNEYKDELRYSADNKEELSDLRYLLSQSIRQYSIPKDHYHISKAAVKRWSEISSDDITKYHYTKKVTCDKLAVTKRYLLYVGADSKGTFTDISPNSRMIFRQMFHEDHIVPVSLILEEMIKMPKVDKNSIKNLLDRMHICVMLKEEDRRIGRTSGRTTNYEQVIRTVYANNGIELQK